MKANEFIEMQRQDIETEKPAEKKILRELKLYSSTNGI